MNLFENIEINPGYDFDRYYLKKYKENIIGIDEVGRGPLAGPVVTAAVVLDYNNTINGLNDSKKLTEKKREALLPLITNNAVHIGVGMAFPAEIDDINIFQATISAMKKSISLIPLESATLLIDGLSFPYENCQSIKVIKGDTKSPAIMAASIVAKIIRDRLMEHYDKLFPAYDFKSHKGYGTKKHIEAIHTNGPCEIHRNSFEPIKGMLKNNI